MADGKDREQLIGIQVFTKPNLWFASEMGRIVLSCINTNETNWPIIAIRLFSGLPLCCLSAYFWFFLFWRNNHLFFSIPWKRFLKTSDYLFKLISTKHALKLLNGFELCFTTINLSIHLFKYLLHPNA